MRRRPHPLRLARQPFLHRHVIRRLRRHDYTYLEEPSIALATAVLLTLIGLVTLGLLVAGALES